MMNKLYTFFGAMSNWMRLGFFLSITWIAGVSFIYFDELANYPSYATRIGSMYLDTSFGWEKDVEKTHEAHVDAINRDEDFSYDAFFLKPIFNISGYFRLILLPIILIWLIMFLMNIFIWIKVKYIIHYADTNCKRTSCSGLTYNPFDICL